MPRLLLFCFMLLASNSAFYAQSDVDKQREKYEKEVQRKQNEMISDFVSGLKADDFQKEIISQKLHSYVGKKQAIIRAPGRQFEKQEKFDYLDDTHFADLSNMVSNEIMLEIRDFITTNHAKKKKKKKRDRKGRENKNPESNI